MLELSTEQGSDSWKQDRAGYTTASRFTDVLSKGRGKAPSKTRAGYMLQCVAERITGVPYNSYKGGAATEHGQELEHEGRMAYVYATGALVEQSPFIAHPKIEWCGASPDGLVGADGMIEIKCPANPMIHLETVLLSNQALAAALLAMSQDEIAQMQSRVLIPAEHMAQVQGNLWVNGRAWCDFISYDPRFPAHLQLYVHRVFRDEAYIKNLEVEVVKFLDEVNDNVSRLITPDEIKAAPIREGETV
jgi:hypothetical protein